MRKSVVGWLAGAAGSALLLATAASGQLGVQAPPRTGAAAAPPAAGPASQDDPYRIVQDVVNIVVPVTVRQPGGTPVGGIRSQQFRLFDMGKLQDIRVDADYLPVSLVMVVQANSTAEGAVERVKKTPALIQSLIIGEHGEAAVLAFDHRQQLKCDFTSDYEQLKKGIEDIKVGSATSALNDAAMAGINMLRRREGNRRRVMLLIAETRDRGSELGTRQVVNYAELHNIQVYAVNITQVLRQFTSKPQPPRPDPIPPEARGLYPGTVNTPTTVAQITGGQGGSAQFVPLIEELYRGVKGVFWRNPQEALVAATGGREFNFATLRGLEEALASLGEELHSQYILSYTPSTRDEGGYHEIRVVVDGYDSKWVKHRPGYFWGGMPGAGN
ncbi:MAG: VWA domain-containing protein [Bryobacterales bacterium]|nr:VWA domain-containing protein [Bryobacterales bacterium]